MITEYKRPGRKPSSVVLTAEVRTDLKGRGFKESPASTIMARDIGNIRISIHEQGNCNINIPNRFHPIEFVVDEYWAKSILYLAQQELHRDAARIRKEADGVTKLAEQLMDVVCGKTK